MKYTLITDFKQGRAIFQDFGKSSSKYGLIDRFGKIILPCIYDVIWPYEKGFSRVSIVLKDKNGVENQCWGLVDLQGKMALEVEYSLIFGPFSNFYHIKYNEKWGAFDVRSQKIEIPFDYDWIYPWENGFAKVRIGNNYHFIDEMNEVINDVSQ